MQAEKDKDNSSSGQAENLAQDMHDLMHDFDVVSRISGLIGSLKGQYEVIFPFLGLLHRERRQTEKKKKKNVGAQVAMNFT